MRNLLRLVFILGLGLAALAAPTPGRAQGACASTARVSVGGATVCGVADASDQVNAFLGLRYATAARWQAPTLNALPTSGTVGATTYGPACYQTPTATLPTVSEDCLYLNVWAPSDATATSKLPVMVFIHGGAFVEGAGSAPIYDGTRFAAAGVVLVTLNYRLGAFGFLAATLPNTPGSQDTSTISGNFGLQDQQTALRWVQRYITAFGGDPGRVTVFGESAGAMSTGLHVFSIPSSAGLFQAAIMESNPFGNAYKTPAAAIGEGARFFKNLCAVLKMSGDCQMGWSWVRQAAQLTPAAILQAQTMTAQQIANSFTLTGGFSIPWGPNLTAAGDPFPVIAQPFQGYAAGTVPVPLAFGTNLNEGTLFANGLYARLAKDFTPANYKAFLLYKFKPATGLKILKIPAYSPDSYVSQMLRVLKPLNMPGTQAEHVRAWVEAAAPMNATAYAAAQLITDYFFNCGNIAAADAALAGGQPVYGYQFTQPALLNLYYPSIPACAPADAAKATGQPLSTAPVVNVCHANELPYVFDTLAATYATYQQIAGISPAQPVPAGDAALATAMNTAWAAFAKNPRSPGPAWMAYTAFNTAKPTSTARVAQWNGGTAAPVALAAQANCPLFLGTAPYAAAPAAAEAGN